MKIKVSTNDAQITYSTAKDELEFQQLFKLYQLATGNDDELNVETKPATETKADAVVPTGPNYDTQEASTPDFNDADKWTVPDEFDSVDDIKKFLDANCIDYSKERMKSDFVRLLKEATNATTV